jgi:hypothetical protein
MQEVYFEGRKPTKSQINKAIKNAIQNGYTSIGLYWGENWIELEYSFNARSWRGYGWIKNLGGDNIAQELNELQEKG